MVCLTVSIAQPVFAQVQTFMSYNIRYNNPNDGVNKWDERKDELVALINNYEPLVFGIQEGLLDQVQYIRDQSGVYDYSGVGRDDGKDKGEFAAIFYNKQELTLLTEGTFWLSETPEKVSKDWDAASAHLFLCSIQNQ